MMNRLRDERGFTLVELVITMVIVGILAVVSVPIYKGFVDKAKATEGVALVGGIRSSERIYYAEHNGYATGTVATVLGLLDLSQPDGKYFGSGSAASIAADATYGFIATAQGNGGGATNIHVRIRGTTGQVDKSYDGGTTWKGYE